jgi:hypothetical protein
MKRSEPSTPSSGTSSPPGALARERAPHARGRVTLCVEIGPGKVLAGVIKLHRRGLKCERGEPGRLRGGARGDRQGARRVAGPTGALPFGAPYVSPAHAQPLNNGCGGSHARTAPPTAGAARTHRAAQCARRSLAPRAASTCQEALEAPVHERGHVALLGRHLREGRALVGNQAIERGPGRVARPVGARRRLVR